MQYLLTDYPEDHLRIFSKTVSNRIDDLVWMKEQPVAQPVSIELWDREISALREHHVHLLTALQIVKDREVLKLHVMKNVTRHGVINSRPQNQLSDNEDDLLSHDRQP